MRILTKTRFTALFSATILFYFLPILASGESQEKTIGERLQELALGTFDIHFFDNSPVVYMPRGFDAKCLHFLQEMPVDFELFLLNDNYVTDEGLIEVAKLSRLTSLELSATGISGKGLRHLAKSRSLRHLQLANTGITDLELQEVAGITRLESLGVAFTKVTNDGLKYLESHGRLTRLC
jgi:hypothetical protein